MTDLTPRPTEYKGIVFRSKSEAMFARWLDLSRGEHEGFIYEPRCCMIGNWKPDFLRWGVHVYESGRLPCLTYEVIEYKPSRPTDTYIFEFAARCGEHDLRHSNRKRFLYSLYYGSVWQTDRGFIEVHETLDRFYTLDNQEDWLVEYEDEIKATRFDLAEPLLTGVT